MFDTKGNFLDYTTTSKISVQPLQIVPISSSYTHFSETQYQKPNLALLLKNELAKTWDFYNQAYYRHDLRRICEIEELVSEWFPLPINSEEERVDMLATYGFPDLLDQE